MEELLLQLRTHTRMVWRFRWVALVCASIFCIVGWATVLTLPNKYEVTAKIFLDTRTLLGPLLRGLALDATSQYDSVKVMRRTLLVRPNLETVARKTDMDLRAETPAQFERLLNGLAKNIKVSSEKGTEDIFEISYENRDAKLATRVVDALLNLFVERQLGASRKDTSASKEFLDAQIKEYESRLIAAENRLKEFKRQNIGLMGGQSGYFSRTQAATTQIREATLELRETEQRRNELKKQLGNVSALLESSKIKVSHPLNARIEDLEMTLDQVLLQYTEQHPDVISTRKTIERLRQQRDEEIQAIDEEGRGAARQIENPIYQELQIAVGAAEAEVAALRARVTEYTARREEMAKLVDTVPKVEAEFSRLNRDYGLDRSNYDQLVARRESLKLAQEASQSGDTAQFNIIEPPREPLTPSAPNRPALNAGVLVGGLVGGMAFAWFLAMLRPTFYTKEGFADVTELPVIGVVSRIWTRRELLQRRMEVASFTLGCLCLFSAYVGLASFEALDVDIVSKIADLRERFI